MTVCGFTPNYVIVGPPGAGKSTVAAALSGMLDIELKSIDVERVVAAARYGFSEARAERIFSGAGAEAYVQYVTKFDIRILADWLREGGPAVIDTSGGLVTEIGGVKTRYGDRVRWVLVWPAAEGPSWWRERITARGNDDEWWSRGGDVVQRAAVRAGAELACLAGIAVVADVHTLREVLPVA